MKQSCGLRKTYQDSRLFLKPKESRLRIFPVFPQTRDFIRYWAGWCMNGFGEKPMMFLLPESQTLKPSMNQRVLKKQRGCLAYMTFPMCFWENWSGKNTKCSRKSFRRWEEKLTNTAIQR